MTSSLFRLPDWLGGHELWEVQRPVGAPRLELGGLPAVMVARPGHEGAIVLPRAWLVQETPGDEIKKNIAWLVTGTINEHFPHPDSSKDLDEDDVLGTPGCVINCGPCGALHALSLTDEGRAEVERLVRLTGFQDGGWAFWDDANDTLRWGWFEGWWAGHKACAVAGSELVPCDWFGAADADDEPVEETTTRG